MDSKNTKAKTKHQPDKKKVVKKTSEKKETGEQVTDVEISEDVERINPDENSMESRG